MPPYREYEGGNENVESIVVLQAVYMGCFEGRTEDEIDELSGIYSQYRLGPIMV